FHHVARTRSVELFMAACLFVVLGTALTTAASGMSMALGAFVAGLLLAETEYRREVEVTLEPFKGLLLGVFFVSIGAGLDLGRIAESPVVVLAIAIGVVALKSAILFGLGLATGMTASVSRNVALPLGPCGEFAFVMIGAATALGLVPAAVGQTVLLAVTLSMVAIPTLIALTIRRGASAQPPGTQAPAGLAPPEDDVARVLVAGYGRVGRLVGDMLARHEIPYIAVDGDADVVRHAHAEGRPAHYGDAARPEFLRRCGIGAARALVVTMDAPAAVERVVAAARAERADLTIVARARDAGHATKLYTLGATDAVPETIEASLQLSEAVLVDIGIPMGLVIASIHEKRDEFRKLLNAGDDLRREPRVRRTVLRPKE
ncbi:MAG: NAD-binding protein, partial [Rhodospirillales bacterium]|nr:NAD-binding protein [Rhodospirillales bacterium]